MNPTSDPNPGVEALGLCKRFGHASWAVWDVSLEVRPGEIFGLLGANGAGKTTTLRMLCGLVPPTSGRARVAGIDVWEDSRRAKALLGYLDEEPFLYPNLSGREFLDFVADLYSVPRGPERARQSERLLEIFELAGAQHDLIGGYSHGMRQKIGMASLLVRQPRALLLDEPTNGLDPRAARRVKDLLRELADRGTAILLSTHILGIAQALADRIGIMNKGQVVAVGTMAELQARSGREDLEELFLDLTGGPEQKEIIDRLLEA